MMARTLFGLLLVGLALTACGCRMCASPYDYCGPLCDGCCGGTCDLTQPRAGEISMMVEPRLLEPNLAEPRAFDEATLSVQQPTSSPTAPTQPAWTARRPTQSQAH